MMRPPLFMCLGPLRRDEHTADVDVDHAIHLFPALSLKRFRNGSAGIVYQNVEVAKGRDGLLDGGFAASDLVASAWITIAFPPLPSISLTTDAAAWRLSSRKWLHSLRLPPGVWDRSANAARARPYQWQFFLPVSYS